MYDRSWEAHKSVYKELEQKVDYPSTYSKQKKTIKTKMYLNIENLIATRDILIFTESNWKPSIICLSETCLTEDIMDDEINVEGYRIVNNTLGEPLYI